MKQEKKDALIASIENVEAIEEFLSEWYTSSDLYETAAKASSILLDFLTHVQQPEEDVKLLNKFLEQHVMMIGLLKNFERKEGEVC